MSLSQFVDLVLLALPEDVRPEELQPLAPKAMWRENPYGAMCQALRECPRINWNAYMERNPDVKQAGADPCQHFIRHGLHEGRKLVSWHGLKKPTIPGAPLLSVILVNRDNAHFLRKCIDSILNQSVSDMELIIVDDGSSDESAAIINAYSAADARIKTLINENNRGLLHARKQGVKEATGSYIMFMNSSDYLAPDAFKIAIKTIVKGYDMVKFGAKAFTFLNLPTDTLAEAEAFYNGGAEREYFYSEILSSIFTKRTLSPNLWSAIYLREIVVSAFEELPDDSLGGCGDALELIAIGRHIRSMLKIEQKLVYHNCYPNLDLKTYRHKFLDGLYSTARTIKAIQTYSEKYSLRINQHELCLDLADEIVKKLLSLPSDKTTSSCFWHLVDTLGYRFISRMLLERHQDKWGQILEFARPVPVPYGKISHIGIYHPVLGHGGVEVVIQTLSQLLIRENYKITIFTEEKSENDLEFPPEVKITYITPAYNGEATLARRMEGFEKAIAKSGIDVMLHAATWRPHIGWDLLTLRQHGIPVIIAWHATFAFPLIGHFGLDLHSLEKAFRSADAVTCLSTMDEFYLRRRGINAIYIPNPVKQIPYEPRPEVPPRIAVIGRFGADEKQAGQSLQVLRTIVTYAPWVSMILIGDFYTDEQRLLYRKKIKEYGIEKNVSLTGWTDHPDYFLKQCGVLLSVSYWEAFPMGIAEAQALGLPCVIYDLDIEQAKNNPSIIKVPQGDFRAAAAAVLDLLENEAEWQKLSAIAVENAKKYSPEKFAARMRALFDNFQLSMPVRIYNCADYDALARNLAFYSKRERPAVWEKESACAKSFGSKGAFNAF